MRQAVSSPQRFARARLPTWWSLMAGVLLLVPACSGDSKRSSDPGGPAPVQPSPTALPSDAAQAPPPSSNVVQVVADGLQVRSAAGTDAPIVGGLERGAVARIESDPVESDGLVWYEVVDLDGNRGWVASGDDEDAWLATLTDQPDGTTLLRFESACDVSGPLTLPPVSVMGDRRVVMGGYDQGWMLWQLTDAGFERLSDAVLESQYLQATAEHVPVVRTGAEPPGHGVCAYTFTIGTGEEPIVVTAVQWLGEEEAFFEPAPERKALDGIAHGLSTLEDSLGPDAWVADPLPYIADTFMTTLGPLEEPILPGTPRVDAGALPAGTSLGDFSDPPPSGICGDLTVAEAFELARVLRESGVDLALDTFSSVVFATDAGWFSVSISPQAPDGYPACSDAGF